MDYITFEDYLSKFEYEVLIKGYELCIFNRTQLVSTNLGVLGNSKFASQMGKLLSYPGILVVDYYGHLKKSYGFIDALKEERKKLNGRQIKMMESVTIHFNSVKIEDIADISKDSFLISNFAEFKKEVLVKRGFKNKA
jgi:hypothetical protein